MRGLQDLRTRRRRCGRTGQAQLRPLRSLRGGELSDSEWELPRSASYHRQDYRPHVRSHDPGNDALRVQGRQAERGEKEKAEGTVFAVAVLLRVHAANPEAAKTIYNNLRVGAPSTDFKAVKAAFESVYEEMGISCADIGGLWSEASKDYYPGMEPCRAVVSSKSTEVVTESNKTLTIALVALLVPCSPLGPP